MGRLIMTLADAAEEIAALSARVLALEEQAKMKQKAAKEINSMVNDLKKKEKRTAKAIKKAEKTVLAIEDELVKGE